jgi:PBP1b-binding outer membrane lipoprotein LpoB
MKKMILIIGLVLTLGLLMAGCAPQPTTEETVETEEVVADEPVETETEDEPVETEDVVADEKTETEDEPEEVVVDEPETAEDDEPEPAKPTTTVTKEDLDKLREGIEGIETEDLGGISED